MILSYSAPAVFENIPLLKHLGYIDKDVSEHFIEIYKNKPWANKLAPMIDRSGTLQHFLPISIKDPFPSHIENFSKTFEEIAINRSKELLSLGKRLNVFWSGGIDSTTLLLLLLEHTTSKDQINVICTYTSIVESGDIFDKSIKNRANIVIRGRETKKYFFSNYIFNLDEDLIITGDCSDMIVSETTGLIHFPTAEDAIKPYREVVESGNSAFDIETLDFIKPTLDKSPRPIKTYQDLTWYYKFNFMWAHTRYSMYSGIDTYVQSLIHVFYNSDDFQRWSINTIPSDITLKPFHRDIIFKLTRNEEYAFKKPKTPSGMWCQTDKQDTAFLMVDGTTKTIKDLLKEIK